MQQIWDAAGMVLQFIWTHLVILNGIFAIIIVFFQRKDPKTVWTWLMLLYFIPVLGFVFYLFLGADMHKRRMFKTKEIEDKLNEAIRQQEKQRTAEADTGYRGFLGSGDVQSGHSGRNAFGKQRH